MKFYLKSAEVGDRGDFEITFGYCSILTLSLPIPLRLYTLPYWSNPPSERQSARMSKIKNGGLDQYGTEPFEQQQCRTAGIEWVKT